MKSMITPDEALAIIFKSTKVLPICEREIGAAADCILARSIRSQDDLPRFDNSAVDGFAVKSRDIRKAGKTHPISLRIIGKIFAGSPSRIRIKKGEAIRIATGARVPQETDAIVMQEDCRVQGSRVLIYSSAFVGAHIRRKGEEIHKGQTALKKHQMLNAGSLAWLGTMGIKKVPVYRKPRIGLLRSGNEVVELHRSPKPHQVRDAHALSISLAAKALGMEVEVFPIASDNEKQITWAFASLLKSCDVVITTGGVSVGEKDLFHSIAPKLGLKTLFDTISQRPGKPLGFGKRGSKLWFGLPGNPVSALVCFYLYIRPALRKMMGQSQFELSWFRASAAESFSPHPKRTSFLRGTWKNGSVRFAEKQGSHCLGSFADANVLVRIDPSRNPGKAGSIVKCLTLSFPSAVEAHLK